MAAYQQRKGSDLISDAMVQVSAAGALRLSDESRNLRQTLEKFKLADSHQMKSRIAPVK